LQNISTQLKYCEGFARICLPVSIWMCQSCEGSPPALEHFIGESMRQTEQFASDETKTRLCTAFLQLSPDLM